MNVPLDNLYHWVDSLLPGPAVLYVFRPHGSKKISDFDRLKLQNHDTDYQLPGVILHDQEPLDWNFYNDPNQYLESDHWKKITISEFDILRNRYCANFNLKSQVLVQVSSIYDQTILVHSEKNSVDLEQYQMNNFVCVHYWAHAIIARDWYRFAKIDTRLKRIARPKRKFLIYCRDWSHRREYRLKFLEMLVQHNLDQVSQTNVMHVNSEHVHFSQHKFSNPAFELVSPELINCVPANTFSSTASADYDPEDFIDSEISVVLETVFDDRRIHLTEKTLRPIACGHPFLLAAGAGSLEYLRAYGFQTFAPWIDESYDSETDSVKRLEKIISAMKQIQNLQGQELEDFLQAIKTIADFNKNHFFSNDFFNCVKSELQNNLIHAYQTVQRTQGKHYQSLLRLSKNQKIKYPEKLRRVRTPFLRQLRQSYPGNQSSPPEDPVV